MGGTKPGRWWGRAGWLVAAVLLGMQPVLAADEAAVRGRFQELEADEAAILAPESYDKARQAIEASTSPARLDAAAKRVQELQEAVGRARAIWARTLEQRDRARAAGADTASASWQSAENILVAAARKLEAGRRDAAERQATSLPGLYARALQEAVHFALVGVTRQRIVQAEKEKAAEYVPRSLVAARDALTSTEKLIAARPGEPDAETRAQAELARRETDHAIYLLETIRYGCEGANRARLESVVLDWESKLRLAVVPLGVEPDFTQGIGPVMQQVLVESDRLLKERNRLRIDLARRSDQADSLQRVIGELKRNVRNFEGLVAELQPFREEANTVQAVRALFMQSDGKVIVDNRDVVLRLHGLRFASGDARLPPESTALLEKVIEAVRAFPGAQVVVEGHTDAKGSRDANMRLSSERANAVRDYLVSQGGLAAARIVAIGHGPSQPVASNDNEEGRALNRRIDIIITRPG